MQQCNSGTVVVVEVVEDTEELWTRSVAVTMKAELHTTYGIAAELNHQKYRVWNSHGYDTWHVTMLPLAIPDMLAVKIFAVHCESYNKTLWWNE